VKFGDLAMSCPFVNLEFLTISHVLSSHQLSLLTVGTLSTMLGFVYFMTHVMYSLNISDPCLGNFSLKI
jgi:hypothetical protein